MRTFTFLKTFLLSALLLFLLSPVSFAQDCALFEDFETMSPNAAYLGKEVTTPNGNWWIVGYSQMDQNDRRLGERSIRLRANNNDTALIITGTNTRGANVVEMLFDKPNGIGSVSFYYGSYSGHSGGVLFVEYSLDGGETWLSPPNNSMTALSWAAAGEEMKEFVVPINIEQQARVRIIKYKQTGTQHSVNIDNLTITNYIPDGHVYAPTFNPPEGTYVTPFEVTLHSCTPGASIRYTLDGSEPTESSELYENPFTVSQETTVKAKAWKEGMTASTTSTVVYSFPAHIATLAQLRALAPVYIQGSNPGTTVYKYTGNAVITHEQDYNNVKYIQDETAAIMIFDRGPAGPEGPGVISIKQVGDIITNITGTLTNYWGMVQIIPQEDCDFVSEYNKVTPNIITASQLDYNHDNPLQSKVVKINNVSYIETGTFGKGKYYSLKENNISYDSVVYTDKFEATYISQTIPTIAVDIIGIVNFKGTSGITTKNRIVPMDVLKAVVLNITNYNPSAIKLSPNPATNFINIVTSSSLNLEIYNILGARVATEILSEGTNTISVSTFTPGVYILKMSNTSTGQTFTHKLVVQ